jgi:hypothetical protein
MAIVSRSLIEATDFSNLAGLRASNRAFPNEQSATSRMNAIFGVGFGDRGYGQASPFINGVAKNSLVQSSDWQGLLSALQTCVSHIGLPITNFPSSNFYDANALITANSFDWADTIETVDQARLNASASSLAQYVALSDTRTALWTEKPGLIAEIDFGTEDAARWFFNSGGRIVINSTFSAGTTNPQDISWQQLLNQDAGTISIGAYNTLRTGGNQSQGILSSNFGYYNLTSSADEVFSIQPLSGLFAVNQYSILVQRENHQGRNGGNGSKVLVNVFFDDQYGTTAQPVTGTLTANISIQKAVAPLLVANPVVNVIQNLNGGGGEVFFPFVETLAANTNNYNLLARAQAAATAQGVPLNIPIRATVIINAGVVVGSTSTQSSAMVIPPLVTGSTVRLINNGTVAGRGGTGGAGWSWWQPANKDGTAGGPALELNWPVTLLNYGTLGGGGGGGGGSSTIANRETYDDPGGSGGGGAGQEGGSPGNVGPVPSYWGAPGNLTTGGTGGFPSPHSRSREWGLGRVGGAGGNLGQSGAPGSGDYGSGLGGAPGAGVIGSSNILSGSINGTILGSLS